MGLLGEAVTSHQLFRQPDGAQGTEWFWAIGVLVTLLGATLTVAGLLVQKQAHSSSSDLDSLGRLGFPVRPYWMHRRWLLGGALWVVGNLVCWVAMGLAPQSILAAINCWNIVITLVIAPWFLGEVVSTRTVLSALLMACGTGCVIACVPKAYQQDTVPLIVEDFKKPQSIAAFGVTFSFLLAMSFQAYNRWQSSSPTLSYFQFTAISACFACYAALLSKSTAKVLVASVQLHQPLYLNITFWIIVAAFPVCAACQVHFLNMGLKFGEAVAVLPMYEAVSMTGQIVIGGLVFNEFAGMSARQHFFLWSGVATVLLGILSLATETRHSPEAKRSSSCEERIPLFTNKYDADQVN